MSRQHLATCSYAYADADPDGHVDAEEVVDQKEQSTTCWLREFLRLLQDTHSKDWVRRKLNLHRSISESILQRHLLDQPRRWHLKAGAASSVAPCEGLALRPTAAPREGLALRSPTRDLPVYIWIAWIACLGGAP